MINDTGMFSRNERFKKMSRLLGLKSKLRFLLVFVFVLQHSIPVFYYYYFSCFHFKYSTYSSLAFLASTSAYQTECKCWRAKFSARGGRVGKRILADKPLMCTFSFPLLPPVSSFSHHSFWALLTWEPLQFRLTYSPPPPPSASSLHRPQITITPLPSPLLDTSAAYPPTRTTTLMWLVALTDLPFYIFLRC